MSYNTQRPLTTIEQSELDRLNENIASAIRQRREWLDAKMRETSRLQVGDDIYDISSGRKLGTVTKLYRFQTGRNGDEFDTGHYCDYEYATSGMGRDNTSRQPGLSYGPRDDAIRAQELTLDRLRRSEAVDGAQR